MQKKETLSFKDAIRTRKAYIGHSCVLHYEAAPLKFERASKQYMYDENNVQYLDCINSHSHVGHCHPHVVRAGQNQMGKLVTCGGFINDAQVLYAQRIASTLPPKLSTCFILNSGSEANDLAVRLARRYTRRKDVIVYEGSFNGMISEMLELSPLKHKSEEQWVHVIPHPDTYRGQYAMEPNASDLYLRDVIDKLTANSDQIAALLHEPMAVASGVIIPPADYIQSVYRAVRSRGGVVIANEMLTGLGRVGKMWSFEALNVVPDIVTCAKPLGNGFPLAIVVTTPEIAQESGDMLTSFGGNPLACSVGLAVLDVIENEKLMSSAVQVGACLLDGFRRLATKFKFIGDVRGQGLVIGVDIVESPESRKPSKEIAEHLVYKLKDRLILTFNGGPQRNVLIFSPPMCFTCENAWHLLSTMEKLLQDFEDGRKEVENDVIGISEFPEITLAELYKIPDRKRRAISVISSEVEEKRSLIDAPYDGVD